MSHRYPWLQKLSHRGRSNIMVKYVPFKAPYENILPRLIDFNSPSHVSAKELYDRMPADQLNWRIVTNVSAKQVPYAILRNHTRNRYYAAFSLALKEQGYHTNGKLLKDALGAGHGPQQPLKGTLELYVFHNKVNDMAFDKLRNDAALVIEAVRKHQLQFQNRSLDDKLKANPKARQDRLFSKIPQNQQRTDISPQIQTKNKVPQPRKRTALDRNKQVLYARGQ